jgi:hypothetical protein
MNVNLEGRLIAVALAAALALMAAGCGSDGGNDGTPDASEGLPQGSERVDLDPADFTTQIDNRYWPMKPGSRWVYRETDSEGAKQRVVVTVTNKTKRVANGIEARVVHDVVSEGGVPVEVTEDWYAQDSAGNVWYLGEDTAELDTHGKVLNRDGTWHAGVDGAIPGIYMEAEPVVGHAYRQEFYAGEAEDHFEVISLTATVHVPFGDFQNALRTKEWTPLEPDVLDNKFYVRGVGQVREVAVKGAKEVLELVKVEHR